MRSGLALLAALLSPVAIANGEKSPARLHGFDALSPRGRSVAIEAKLERQGLLGVHPDLHGVELVFESGVSEIGRARTGRDGIARIAWDAPPGTTEHAVRVRVADGSRFSATPAPLRVFTRDPARSVLVVDLDGTVCASSGLFVATRPASEIEARVGAAAALGRLAARFDVVYLTARDDALAGRSREWLDLRGFPHGPVLVRDVRLSTLSAEKYKTERLRALARDFRLAAGVGDRDEDARAYLAAGMEAIHLGGARGLPERARRAADWAEAERLLSAPR